MTGIADLIEKHSTLLIFIGTITTQAGFFLLFRRRYNEISAKYFLVSEESRAIKGELKSLRNVLSNVESQLSSLTQHQNDTPSKRAGLSSSIRKNLSKNQIKSEERNTTIFRVESATSESDYADAMEYEDDANMSTTSASVLLLNEDRRVSENNMQPTQRLRKFATVDKLHEDGEAQKSLNEIKKIYESTDENKKNLEVLWRYARAYYSVSSTVTDISVKKKLLQDGQKYAQEAYKLDENNFNVVKYAAIVTGALTEHLATKDKIQEGYVFKGYLDKGLSMKPNEQTLLHMRGRFSYSVANLSWFERKAASTFFATPPKATFDEAIADFLENSFYKIVNNFSLSIDYINFSEFTVEKIVPGTWIENLLFLGKSYLGKGDKDNALKYLNMAVKNEAADEADKEALAEARTLISKNSK